MLTKMDQNVASIVSSDSMAERRRKVIGVEEGEDVVRCCKMVRCWWPDRMVRSSWWVRGGRSRAVASPPGCLSSFHLRPREPEPAHLPSWEHHHPLLSSVRLVDRSTLFSPSHTTLLTSFLQDHRRWSPITILFHIFCPLSLSLSLFISSLILFILANMRSRSSVWVRVERGFRASKRWVDFDTLLIRYNNTITIWCNK